MIIFDLDGTLADCEHRRHFVDRHTSLGDFDPDLKPDWRAFYEACDKDTPIQPVISIWNDQISLGMMGIHEIWSGRCESVRDKTEAWLDKNLLCFESKQLKMRPIGDNTPDEKLKERWLDEALAQGKTIDFVFDDRPKVVRMWRRRGIFVFDVNQSGKEF
jgi:hypothetical protein